MNPVQRLQILLLVALLVVGLVFAFGEPFLNGAVAAFEPGVSLKTAAIWSFGVTVVLFVLLALVAGELQFMLSGFFLFFAVITLLIAWVF